MIKREKYLNELINFKDKKLIKVVTGIRRCGKSTLFMQFIDYLKSIGIKDNQIININLENPEYSFKCYMDLYNYINEQLKTKNKYYIFLDEVQNVKDFERAVDGLYIKENVDLYITGSNAYMLSGELATLLSGRYIEIKMLPLSFKEYVSAFDEKKDINKMFLDYMRYGGLPQTIEFYDIDMNMIDKYLDGIFSTIIYKDIMTRNNINDKLILESVIKFVFDSIGSPISTKKISDTLTSMNRATSNHTVENYISAFLESFLIYKTLRYDTKGKTLLASGYKYYVADTGLRSYLLGKKADSDMEHILENIIYLELLRRGYKVYTGKVDNMEIDFVAENREGIKYYQVALSVRDEKTLERELKSLQKTGDHYPKILLTMDDDLDTNYDGIIKLNVVNWLLKED